RGLGRRAPADRVRVGGDRAKPRSGRREPARSRGASDARRRRKPVRRLLAVHPLCLPALSSLRSRGRRGGRVQRQVHGWPVGPQGRQLRDRARPFAGELPQLLLPAPALAVHWAAPGEGTVMAAGKGIALVELDESGVDKAFRADVLEGLAQTPKAVPARWFYDEEGSRLFEAITRLPEYYPTRAETEIQRSRCADLRELIEPRKAVVELGSGSSVKTPLLLECIAPAAYVPLDISGDFLRASAAELAGKFPKLPIYPVEADFMKPVRLPADVEG